MHRQVTHSLLPLAQSVNKTSAKQIRKLRVSKPTNTCTHTHTRTVKSEIYTTDSWFTNAWSNSACIHMHCCVSESDIAFYHCGCTIRTEHAALSVSPSQRDPLVREAAFSTLCTLMLSFTHKVTSLVFIWKLKCLSLYEFDALINYSMQFWTH